jgi:hypothetical protein
MSATEASVLFSGVVALATAVYAVLTWMLVAETRRLRRAQTDAHVSAALYLKEGLIHFVHLLVRNDGVGPAMDVAFDLRPLTAAANQKVLVALQGLGIVKYGIRYMAPGQEFKVWLTSVLEEGDSKMKTAVEMGISFNSTSGERRTERYVLDFAMFEGFKEVGKPPLPEIAENVKKIATELGYLGSGFHGLNVRIDGEVKGE